jgi:hypothetical protein
MYNNRCLLGDTLSHQISTIMFYRSAPPGAKTITYDMIYQSINQTFAKELEARRRYILRSKYSRRFQTLPGGRKKQQESKKTAQEQKNQLSM